MPLSWYSTGSSTGDDLLVGAVDLVERRVERRRLARARRPGHQQDAVGLLDQPREDLRDRRAESEAVEGHEHGGAVEEAHHDRLAVNDRHGGDANVHPTVGSVRRMRPSCGRRRSAMFISAISLMRDVSAACSRRGGAS